MMNNITAVRKKSQLLIALIVLVLIVDQCSKFWVKTHMYIGENIEVFSWFHILFVENNGMAFGMELIGKLFLSIFRVVAIGAIIYLLSKLIKKEYCLGYLLCIGLILAGALGNLIDSAFYGLVFNDSVGQVATFLNHPEGQPNYAPFLYGKVVDMLYFPIISNARGETLFFSPVFNVADSAVSIGVFTILLFYRKELNASLESKSNNEKSIDEK